jgi:CRP/FNR family transcriptional regulator, cyclic AMP receptor protein
MIPASIKTTTQVTEREDPLHYLSKKPLVEYKRGQIIYNEDQTANGIYLLASGRVMTIMPGSDGSDVVLDIVRSDQFFGLPGLLGASHRGERAEAMERSFVMFWPSVEIEEQIERYPKLGIALMQLTSFRIADLTDRIESMANEKTPERVARILLRFSKTLGQQQPDGAVQMPPLTHQTLSNCVGTSREIVTFHMNRLRQLGFLRYSRRGIEVYAEALRDRLRQGPLE